MNLGNFYLEYPASYGLIGFFILVFFAGQNDATLSQRWLLSSWQIKNRKQYYRLISSGFVHDGIVHLLLNGMGIYYFATMVESMVGSIFTLLIFLFSVLGGSLFSIWMRRKESDYQALGASGGVLGLLLCAVMWFPEIKLGLLFIPIPIPGWIFCILFNLGSIVFSQTADRQRISHEGHLGGALFGGVIGFALLSLFVGISMDDSSHTSAAITKIPFESWALFWFGVFPILLLGVVSWIRPQWLYRK